MSGAAAGAMAEAAVAAAESASYKARKEAFVSNLSGSTLTDINLVTLVATSAVLLWTILKRHGLLPDDQPVLSYAVDFLLNVCAILFAFTLYSSTAVLLNVLLIVPGVLLSLSTALQPPKRKGKLPASQTSSAARDDGSDGDATGIASPAAAAKSRHSRMPKSVTTNKVSSTNTNSSLNGSKAGGQGSHNFEPAIKLVNRPFLTNYRGGMLIATILAILAVDFPIFPRRFAKVETWGTSLMDLGVGSFVFSAGVVSARAVLRSCNKPVVTADGRDDWESTGKSLLPRFVQAFRHSLPLLILGAVRLISVKNLDYAEHVTEYGVHWNFFFTLALLPPFVELADILTGRRMASKQITYVVIALVVATVYELVLDNTSLLSYILISPRTPASSLLAKNREGVFSFVGYLAIFLIGRGLGTRLCRFDVPIKAQRSRHIGPGTVHLEKVTDLRWILGFVSLVFWALYWTVTNPYVFNFGLIVSRRLANLPYVLWIAAYNCSQLLLFEVLEQFGPSFGYGANTSPGPVGNAGTKGNETEDYDGPQAATSQIMRSFNKNGLAVFLVANLLTGLVNLTMNTLEMPAIQAMAVLIAYAAAVTAVAVGLDLGGLNIKL